VSGMREAARADQMVDISQCGEIRLSFKILKTKMSQNTPLGRPGVGLYKG